MYNFIKSSFATGLIVLAICAVFLFTIKHKVQILRKELKDINAQILTEKENIHVLQAEYAYLTSPKRIQKLTSQHLNLQTPKPDQVIDLQNLAGTFQKTNLSNSLNLENKEGIQ